MLTPAFQSISQLNLYTGEIIKIKTAVEFPTLECAQAVALRLGGKLVPVPANLPGEATYVKWYEDVTGDENPNRYDLSFTQDDSLSPPSWSLDGPRPAITYTTFQDGPPPNAPTVNARVPFSLNAGRLAYYWILTSEGDQPAYSYWSDGKIYAAYALPEQRARNLILLAERDAFRAASGLPTAPSLFPAG